jgi:hypothetical protein
MSARAVRSSMKLCGMRPAMLGDILRADCRRPFSRDRFPWQIPCSLEISEPKARLMLAVAGKEPDQRAVAVHVLVRPRAEGAVGRQTTRQPGRRALAQQSTQCVGWDRSHLSQNGEHDERAEHEGANRSADHQWQAMTWEMAQLTSFAFDLAADGDADERDEDQRAGGGYATAAQINRLTWL